ncbi:hypothetical protein N9Z91_04025 [Akkermansiaceae bacterium]|nr:hypothetical protein [Akkermansiaceae bacterium]
MAERPLQSSSKPQADCTEMGDPTLRPLGTEPRDSSRFTRLLSKGGFKALPPRTARNLLLAEWARKPGFGGMHGGERRLSRSRRRKDDGSSLAYRSGERIFSRDSAEKPLPGNHASKAAGSDSITRSTMFAKERSRVSASTMVPERDKANAGLMST